MCSILGIVDFTNKLCDKDFKSMLSRTSHRGPDFTGFNQFATAECKVFLGHNRLSIIDLSAGANQPMTFGSYSIIFNGEIYNYKELKENLVLNGAHFSTNSDTEVLLKGYILFGVDFLGRINGMFSFLIFNQDTKQIFCARDRLGVKPLNYFFDNKTFVVTSELRVLHDYNNFDKEINSDAVSSFFKFGYIGSGKTIFKSISKLNPGHYLIFDIDSKDLRIKQYWSLSNLFSLPKLESNYLQIRNELYELLVKSVNLRLVSDVPVGIFLSGGVDSSIVSLIAKQNLDSIQSFTVGFEDKQFDETDLVVSFSEHYKIRRNLTTLTAQNAIQYLANIANYWDEPFGDISVLPSLELSCYTSSKVKVALSADGGDELFAGYTKYKQALFYFRLINFLPFRKLFGFLILSLTKYIRKKANPLFSLKLNKIDRFAEILVSKNIIECQDAIISVFPSNELNSLLNLNKYYSYTDQSIDLQNLSDLDKLMFNDLNNYLPNNILRKVDIASMAFGVEAREPLLDFNLVEYSILIPEEIKIRNGHSKFILKDILKFNFMHDLFKSSKKGFVPPVINWLYNEFKSLVDENINQVDLENAKIFNVDYTLQIKASFFAGNTNLFNRLWLVLIYILWSKSCIDKIRD